MAVRPIVLVACLVAASAARAQPRSFDARGWGSLRWTMSCDEAASALRRSGRALRSDERVGIFPGAGRTVTERRFSALMWREGRREATAECEDRRLLRVAFVTRDLRDERDAERRFAMLVSRFGAPTIEAPSTYGRVRGWTNVTTRLLFSVSRVSERWSSREEWSPASRP